MKSKPPGDGDAGCLPRRPVHPAPGPPADGRPGAARRPVGRGHPRRLQIRPLVPARAGTDRRRRERGRRPTACRATPVALRRLKALGFSDKRLAELTGQKEAAVTAARAKLGVMPVYKRIDTCAGEFASATAYMYATYEGGFGTPVCEADPTDRTKIIILGGGPNRIGQGIEFDYCCVHAAYALREAGFETIMVNCNPETVSHRLRHLRPAVFRAADRRGRDRPGPPRAAERHAARLHRPIWRPDPAETVARRWPRAGIPILGTSADAIDIAEDRERFQVLLQKLGLRQPENGIARSAEQAEAIAERIGYPGRHPPQLRAGRPRDGDRLRPRRPAPLHARGRARLRRQPGADRPLPQRRHRSGRGLHLPTARPSMSPA